MRYAWPEPYTSAVVLSFDVDAEAPLVNRAPDSVHPYLGEYHERLFGINVGVDRILRLLDRFAIPGSFYVPGYTVRTHTSTVAAIHAAGHELACHGDVHERLGDLDERTERDVMGRQLAAFEDLLDLRPPGFRAPSWSLNAWTPGILAEHGFIYDSSLMSDDVPTTLQTPHGVLAEIPVHWLLDDVPLYRHVYGATNAIADPSRVLDLWSREFEAMHAENGCYVLTMHPWVSGRASRIAALAELIEQIRSQGDVWVTTALEVARWHLSSTATAANPVP